MNYTTYIPLMKVPPLLRSLVAWRIGAEDSTLDLTPSSMGLSWESSPQSLGLRCTLRLWPGTREERDFTLADFQFRARQLYLEKWLHSALPSGASSKEKTSSAWRTTLRWMHTQWKTKGLG